MTHSRLFLRKLPAGFAISAGLASLLLTVNLGGVWELATTSDSGLVGLAALVGFNGLMFSLVLFAVAVVLHGMERRPSGSRDHLPARAAIPVYAPRMELQGNYRR